MFAKHGESAKRVVTPIGQAQWTVDAKIPRSEGILINLTLIDIGHRGKKSFLINFYKQVKSWFMSEFMILVWSK